MSNQFHGWELFMSLLGTLGALVVIAVYVLLPQHRKHPAELILTIAICDLCLALRFLMRSIAFLAHPGPYDHAYSMHAIDDHCVSSVVWSTLWETGSLAWNGVWCFNFVYQLRYPSARTDTFYPYYMLYALISLAVIMGVVMGNGTYGLASYGEYEFCGEGEASLHSASVSVVFAYTVCTLLFALASLVYAHNRLGTLSGPNSRLLLVRHAAYVVIFFILWLGQRLINRFHSHVGVHQVIALLWIAQSFFVACVRMSEPRVLPALLRRIGVSDKFIHRIWPKEGVYAFTEKNNDPLLESLVTQDDQDLLVAEHSETSSFSMSMKEFGERSASNTSGPDRSGGAWGPSPAIRAELEIVDAMGTTEQTNLSRLEFNDDVDTVSMHGDV